jgi:O-antigen/teichoic acid export membrane protein
MSQPPSTSAYRRFVRRVGLSGIASATVNLRNVILLPFLTKGLDVATYGAWVQALPLVELGTHLAALSMPTAVTRFCGQHAGRDVAARGIWSAMAFSATIGTLIAGIGWWSAQYLADSLLHDPRHTALLRIACLMIPVSACERLLMSFLQARLQMLRHSSLVILETTSHVGLAIFLLQTGHSAEDVLLSMLAVRGVILILATWLVGGEVGLRLPSDRYMREYLSFGLPLALVGVMIWMTGLSDRYILGYFHGPAPVGGYAVAYTLGMTCTLLFAPVFMILTPTLVELWEVRDLETLRGHLRHTVRYSLAVTVPAVILLSVFARPLVDIVSTSGYPADPLVMALLAAGLLLWMLSALSETVLGTMKETRSVARVYGLATLLNTALNLLLIPVFEIRGAAVATFLSYMVMLWAMDREARGRGLRVPIDWLFVTKCCAAAALTGLAALALRVDGVWQLGGALLGTGTLYLLLLIGLRTFSRGEIAFWRTFISK